MSHEEFPWREYTIRRPEGPDPVWDRWRTIHVDHTRDLRRMHTCDAEVFVSIQRFAAPRYLRPEPRGDEYVDAHTVPLYLSFAGARCLGPAFEDARAVVRFLSSLGCRADHVRVYLCGERGVSVLVAREALGLGPSAELTYQMGTLARWLARELELRTFVDSVYSVPRVWCLPNTRHRGARTFCVAMRHHELESAEHVLELARRPRSALAPTIERVESSSSSSAAEWARGVLSLETVRRPRHRTHRVSTIAVAGVEAYPACIRSLLDSPPAWRGIFNAGVLQLMTYAYARGDAQHDAVSWIDQKFAQRLAADLTSKAPGTARRRSVESTARSVYRSNKYWFRCADVLELADGVPGAVACDGPSCPYVDAAGGLARLVRRRAS